MGDSVTLYSANGCKTAADLIGYVLITLYDTSMAGILSAMQALYIIQLTHAC
jgi:hypothetical protein